jgi:16S rRNA (cytidine1402-2'-O)-methyltransferase
MGNSSPQKTAEGYSPGPRAKESGGAGVLYVCATPIGNLEDATFRLVRILSEVNVIAAEDTRLTRRLLTRYNIQTPLISYHQHSPSRKTDAVLARLAEGQSIALVCNAGTPGVSDPGVPLVEAAAAAGIAVTPIPGPSAVTAALSASGLPAQSFHFYGFLPKKAMERRQILTAHADDVETAVFYESPERVMQTVYDLYEVWGDRRAVLFRELTKIHEETIRGSLSELLLTLENRPLKGEITLVVAGKQPLKKSMATQEADLMRWLEEYGHPEATTRELVCKLVEETGCSRNAAYRAITRWKGRKKA